MLEKNIQNNSKRNKYHQQGGNKQWPCIVQNEITQRNYKQMQASKREIINEKMCPEIGL